MRIVDYKFKSSQHCYCRGERISIQFRTAREELQPPIYSLLGKQRVEVDEREIRKPKSRQLYSILRSRLE